MEKKSFVKIIFGAVIVSVLVNVFFSRWITAKISTLPLLNRLKLLDPLAPIVINQRQEIRVADSDSLIEAVNKSKNKISILAVKNPDGLKVLGGAINLTSNGLFLTVRKVLPLKPSEELFAVLNNGRIAKVEIAGADSASDLVILKGEIENVPTASFGSSGDLQAGERVAVLINSVHTESASFAETAISARLADFFGKQFDSDRPARAFALARNDFLGGSAVISAKSEVVGMVSNGAVISSDVIKKFIALYFLQGQNLARPEFGFIYKMLTKPEGESLGLPTGALVLEVKKVLPAQDTGLSAKDVIISVENETVSEGKLLEEILEKYKPGDTIDLKVYRQGKELILELKVGELK